MDRKFVNKSADVIKCIDDLDNLIRAEYNTRHSFLDYFAGKDVISSVKSVKNEVIYGRRGAGKTHLLRVLQESLISDKEYFPVYIDLRNVKPLLDGEAHVYYALVIFKEIVVEIIKSIHSNIDYICGLNSFDNQHESFKKQKEELVSSYLERFLIAFKGDSFKKLGEIRFNDEEIEKVETSFKLSRNPELSMSSEKTKEYSSSDTEIKYMSFVEIAECMNSLLNELHIERLYCLIDEWSEIPIACQPLLSELLKRAFTNTKVTYKISAIPNRTKFSSESQGNRIGLEEGGDIFGFQLDNRYIYEINQNETKAFFNELLYNQLRIVDDSIFKNGGIEDKTLNLFLANQALREILIASAGIPRDFLNLFIRSYRNFIGKGNSKNKNITLPDIRTATVSWYETDKQKAVENNSDAKIFLDKLIQEIIVEKKRWQFLIPQKYDTHKVLNDLIDYRVLHVKRRGYSHKGTPGVSYNVYSVDYACYTSANIYHNKLDRDLLTDINTTENLRDIRRVSLSDIFFDEFDAEIGNVVKCTHANCGKLINTQHPAFVKQQICHHCFEKIE
jgi:energy-coupling factor transporter ATP-binding protein EcfA2